MKKILLLFILLSTSVFAQEKMDVEALVLEAINQFEKVETTGNWTDNFDKEDLMTLPIGNATGNDNALYKVAITKVKFYPEYSEVTVFCQINIPQGTDQKGGKKTPKSLYFGADGVKISKKGGIIGDAKLTLLGDVNIELGSKWGLSLYGGFDMETGAVKNQTYVTIDCEGFKELHINGAVHFSNELIKRIDPNTGDVIDGETRDYIHPIKGPQLMPNRVKGEFDFFAKSWNDIIAKVSLEPFTLAEKQNGQDYKGNFQFHLNNAVLDLSDSRNDGSVIFPEEYHEQGLLFPTVDSWRGVFVQSLSVALPAEFKVKDNADKRIELGAKNLIIDKHGVSGIFSATNVFPLDKGATSTSNAWAYSLDLIEVGFVTNQLKGGRIAGDILLPISKAKESGDKKLTALGYNGYISKREYGLQVMTKEEIDFNIWQAKGTLDSGSAVELKVKEGKFLPKANLSGNISFLVTNNNFDQTKDQNNEGSKPLVAFQNIKFQNLQLQTVSPMISVDYMGTQGDLKFNNFPVSISDINVRMGDTYAALNFKLGLNLMESNMFSAKGGLSIVGKLSSEGVVQKWRFEKVDISSIDVNGSFAGLKVEGELNLMRKDPLYGDGFNARLMIEYPSVGSVESKAIFGRKDFRYWYFDTAVNFSGAFITGFGGGAYYKMQRKAGVNPTEFSPSGLAYTPNKEIGLGVKAMITMGMGKDLISLQASYEMATTSSGGVAFIGIYGNGKILGNIPGVDKISKVIEKVNSKTKYFKDEGSFDITKKLGLIKEKEYDFSQLEGKTQTPSNKLVDVSEEQLPRDKNGGSLSFEVQAGIELDFINNSFFGSFKTFLHVPGNVIQGTGPEGSVGYAEFYKGPKEWHIYVGTPDQRIGTKIGIGGMFIKNGSYYMAGTKLPDSPAPPSHVARILGVDAKVLDYMRDENQLASGTGLAFGSSLDVDTGNLNFLIMYARFMAGMGFDIMLRDYGEASCLNTSSDKIGINGWYANGQAYAYLQGELGIRVKLWFIKMKIPILTAGAAALMQAKLPNPFWARGYVGGHMNVLGGLIKGKFRFKVTIGKECEFADAGILGGMKMITDLTPKDASEDVDVFTAPQATFSMKVNEPFIIPEDSGDNTYRVNLDKFRIIDESGVEVPSTLELSQMKDRATILPVDILGSHKKYTAEVEVSFFKEENGSFTPVMDNGKPAKETKTVTFVSGEAPEYIPLHNIKYSYPVVDQQYFYTKEYPQGYIQLKQGQDYLFELEQWDTSIKISEKGSKETLATPFSYNNTTNQVSYELPKKIKNSKEYYFSIISKSKTGKVIAKEKTRSYSAQTESGKSTNEEGNEISVEQKQAETVLSDGEVDRLSYNFNTSMYKNFIDKMKRIKTTSYNFGGKYSDAISLDNSISSEEPFESIELVGSKFTDNKPLLQPEATLEDKYFTVDINPYLYATYPIEGKYTFTHRDTEDYGVVPSKALFIRSYYLMSADRNANKTWRMSYFPYTYNLGQVYKEDWVNLTNQMVNDAIDQPISPSSAYYELLRRRFEFMRTGDYNIKVKYTLPGERQKAEYIYKYKNLNEFRF
ncbi:Ig-like domain-containing protein [Myroides odoratimimus]|uniref:Ig-like domain-containing protein n=1 Tax=Myroides odoratimimus TaxID=76832 RepID=UPI0038D36A33